MSGVENQIKSLDKKMEEYSMTWLLAKNAKMWFIVAMTILVLWFATIGTFVWYLSQYDYTSTVENDAKGIYAIIDSNGNIISQDISPEMYQTFLEWWELNGDSKNEGN